MGGLCSRYCCKRDKRQYLRTRYNVEREMSVEFDNLMDDDSNPVDGQQYGAVMTEQERKLLSERKFHDLVQYQRKVDAEIEEQLREQEEQLRMEEEAFYEAKRQAARVAMRLKSKEQAAKQAVAKRSVQQSWLGKDADEWEIGGEDFEHFLESVRKRSLNTSTRSVPCQVHMSSTETRTVDLKSSVNSVTGTATQVRDSNVKVEEVAAETDQPKPTASTKLPDVDWEADFVSASEPPATLTVTKVEDPKV